LHEATLKYEYQTLEMPFSFGIMKPQMPDIAAVLNDHGREGWQLRTKPEYRSFAGYRVSTDHARRLGRAAGATGHSRRPRATPFPQALARKRPSQWDELNIEWFSRSGVALPVEALQGSQRSVSLSPFDIRRLTPCAGALPAAGRHLCFVDPSSRSVRKLQ
jgi:hypothetical protein